MITPVSTRVSDNYQTNLHSGIGDKFAALATKIGQNLSRVFKRASDNAVPTFGQHYRPGDGKTIQSHIGGFRVLGDKRKGVEPGFDAKRDWTARDTAKLADVEHKFHVRAQSMAGQWLRSADAQFSPGDDALKPMLRQALQGMAASATAHARTANEMLRSADSDPTELLAQIRDKQAMPVPFVQALASTLVELAAKEPATDNRFISQADSVLGKLREGVMSGEVKFNKTHYVKLDYYAADKFLGRYQIPKARAKGNFFTAALHRFFTGQTAKARNEGAVRETLANDLMRSLGIESQKLKLVQAKHDDGTPKLMLDGTHVENFKDFDGKPERGERYFKDGVLVRNTQLATDAKDIFNGPPVVDNSMPEFGRNKILMLLMADRDALGSKGANKGYVGNTFVGIDPGHALEEKLLGRVNDVRSDFSFRQPKGPASLGYKNFTVFDQSTLSEKMEGVRQIDRLAASGADGKIFDLYAEKFDATQHSAANFKQTITHLKELYERRRDALLDVFSERLDVDAYDLGAHPDSDTHHALRDIALNTLDGLEKFTSHTTAVTKSGIALTHLQIATPADRKEWYIHQDEGTRDILFTVSGKPGEIRVMARQIIAYLPTQEKGSPTVAASPDSRALTVRVPLDELAQFGARFGHEALLQHKHPTV